jgi:hypothetical protein
MTYVAVRFRDAPPPSVPRSPRFPSSDDEPPRSLWRGEGWGGVLAGDPGDRAHTPQQRGGANSVKVGGLRHIGGGGLLTLHSQHWLCNVMLCCIKAPFTKMGVLLCLRCIASVGYAT